MPEQPRPIRVVVCDDDAQRSGQWRADIEQTLKDREVEVVALRAGEFANAVKDLHARVGQSRGTRGVPVSGEAVVFDNADFVVIDSDLTPDPSTVIEQAAQQAVSDNLVGEFGSNVAWLARNFSDAGLIVVVNHINKSRVFDLTLTRFAHLPADAYVSADDIASPGLWEGVSSGGFRPWSWPNLLHLSKLSAGAAVSLDSRVSEVLGLTEDEAALFDQRQADRLSVDGPDFAALKLRDVARSTTYGYGHQSKADLPEPRELSIGLHGLRRWLDHTVLPAQNVYVDLPHLLQDRPWLAGSARKDVDSMNELIVNAWPPQHNSVAVEAFSESASRVVGRALWSVFKLSVTPESGRVEPDDLVFCEDTSTFSAPGNAREFISDIEGAYQSRFVQHFSTGVTYSPARRLAV